MENDACLQQILPCIVNPQEESQDDSDLSQNAQDDSDLSQNGHVSNDLHKNPPDGSMFNQMFQGSWGDLYQISTGGGYMHNPLQNGDDDGSLLQTHYSDCSYVPQYFQDEPKSTQNFGSSSQQNHSKASVNKQQASKNGADLQNLQNFLEDFSNFNIMQIVMDDAKFTENSGNRALHPQQCETSSDAIRDEIPHDAVDIEMPSNDIKIENQSNIIKLDNPMKEEEVEIESNIIKFNLHRLESNSICQEGGGASSSSAPQGDIELAASEKIESLELIAMALKQLGKVRDQVEIYCSKGASGTEVYLLPECKRLALDVFRDRTIYWREKNQDVSGNINPCNSIVSQMEAVSGILFADRILDKNEMQQILKSTLGEARSFVAAKLGKCKDQILVGMKKEKAINDILPTKRRFFFFQRKHDELPMEWLVLEANKGTISQLDFIFKIISHAPRGSSDTGIDAEPIWDRNKKYAFHVFACVQIIKEQQKQHQQNKKEKKQQSQRQYEKHEVNDHLHTTKKDEKKQQSQRQHEKHEVNDDLHTTKKEISLEEDQCLWWFVPIWKGQEKKIKEVLADVLKETTRTFSEEEYLVEINDSSQFQKKLFVRRRNQSAMVQASESYFELLIVEKMQDYIFQFC